MEKIILLDEEYVLLYYVPKYKVGVTKWSGGKISSENYRKTFETLINYINDGHDFVNYISDLTNQPIIPPTDRKWFQSYVLIEAEKVGLKRGAVVISGNPFKKYYMNLIIRASGKYNINIKLFSDMEVAQKWVVSFKDYE